MKSPNGAPKTILILLLIICGLNFFPISVEGRKSSSILKYGVNPYSFTPDPQYSDHFGSYEFNYQICEGLFDYNLTDPNMGIIPVLAFALGTWNAETTEYTVQLKEDVTFHDGSAFTSADVVWTFNRILSLYNKGVFSLDSISYDSLQFDENAEKEGLFFEDVAANGDYEVIFKVNSSIGILPSILCGVQTAILPSDAGYPIDKEIDAESTLLIGTGPYQCTEYSKDGARLEYYDDWHGLRPENFVKTIQLIAYYNDEITKNEDYLSGYLDLAVLNNDKNLTDYKESSLHEVDSFLCPNSFRYLSMNNEMINKTIRQAMSYAINYSHIIEDFVSNDVVPLRSPIPKENFYHNPNLNSPIYNLTHARQILIDEGIAPVDAKYQLNNDTWWINLADHDPISTFNCSYRNSDEDMAYSLHRLMDYIGIQVSPYYYEWIVEMYNYLDIRKMDEQADIKIMTFWSKYYDPYFFTNAVFHNTSIRNLAHVNDPYLEELMAKAANITEPILRQELYFDIQEYLVEDLMPNIYLCQPICNQIRSIKLNGLERTPRSSIRFASVYWTGEGNSIIYGFRVPGYSFLCFFGAITFVLSIIYKKDNPSRKIKS